MNGCDGQESRQCLSKNNVPCRLSDLLGLGIAESCTEANYYINKREELVSTSFLSKGQVSN